MVWDPAAEAKITGFLETLRAAGLRLEYTIKPAAESSVAQPHAADLTSPKSEDAEDSAPLPQPVQTTPIATPRLRVDFTGDDAPFLIERGGELLHAIESVAASILRLEPEENDQLSFDALGFKQARDAATARIAQQGIDAVHATGQPFVYPPMNSRERRMLHLVLANSGLPTASSGDGPRRFVVVYPAGATPTPERFTPPSPARPAFSHARGRGTSNSRGGRGPQRNGPDKPSGRFSPNATPPPPSIAAPRLDPNGNPLEQPLLPDVAAAVSEDERLASLRRAFRKR